MCYVCLARSRGPLLPELWPRLAGCDACHSLCPGQCHNFVHYIQTMESLELPQNELPQTVAGDSGSPLHFLQGLVGRVLCACVAFAVELTCIVANKTCRRCVDWCCGWTYVRAALCN